MANKDRETAESCSTEDLLVSIEELNERVSGGEVDDSTLQVGSLDVSTLYPSIDTKLAAKIIREE